MKRLVAILMLWPFSLMATPVNINKADAGAISEALTGIGPKKAEAIVQYRTEHGDFKSLDELEKVSGIGEKTIKANENDILFGDDVVVNKPVEVGSGQAGGEVGRSTKK